MWKIITNLLSVVTLFFVVWIFIHVSSIPKKSVPKFFSSSEQDFVCVYLDRYHKQITLLGQKIPYQTIDYDGDKNCFTFVFKTNENTEADGHFANDVLHLFQGSNLTKLQSSSPKDLMKNVSKIYMEAHSNDNIRL